MHHTPAKPSVDLDMPEKQSQRVVELKNQNKKSFVGQSGNDGALRGQ